MEDEQVVSVLVCSAAKEMWDKLITVHEQKSASNVGALTQRFYSYKMGPTDTAIQHVSAIQNMARQLIDLGERISDAAVIAKVLSSLTPKFNVFRTAWDSMDPARQTITYLLERLLREDSNDSEDGDTASALAVTRQSGSRDCARSKEKDTKKKKSKKNIECFRCQEMGHYASQCKQRKKEGDSKDNNKGQSNRGCAFVVQSQKQSAEARVVGDREQQPSSQDGCKKPTRGTSGLPTAERRNMSRRVATGSRRCGR